MAKIFPERRRGFSIIEILLVIAIIGLIAAIVIPTISRLRESAERATAMQNAKNVAQMSEALGALGVAHVIPDSMGGVEATARLFREGVIVPEGPMAGERFSLSGMEDRDIEAIAEFLEVRYSRTYLRLVYRDPDKPGASGIFDALSEETYLLAAATPIFTPLLISHFSQDLFA